MSDSQNLPSLLIVPTEKLVLHEYHDHQRAQPLAKAIQRTGMLRNPPIVVPLKADSDNRYMVLDGANRATSIKSLGIEHVVVQVVDPDDPGLTLSAWNHVIWGIATDELLARFMDIPDIVLQPTKCERALLTMRGIHSLAVICCPDGNAYDIRTPRLMLLQHISLLNALVDAYQVDARMDRTQIMSAESLRELYPDFCGLLIIPSLRIDQLMQVAASGQMMPSGSTRFTISPRVLYLNYPLSALASDHSLEEKNLTLQHFLQERLSNKKVRYYEESTFIFDE